MSTRDEIEAAVRAAGCTYCGSTNNPYLDYPVGALRLQQNAKEFADFVHFMHGQPPAKLGLDIGIASGGATKFVRDYYPIEKTIVVDDGNHPEFEYWKEIKQTMKSELVLEIIANSTEPKTRELLLPFAGQIDYAFIDGGHDYGTARSDVQLVTDLAKEGAIIALHDTYFSQTGVIDLFNEMQRASSFEVLAFFHSCFGISVLRYKGPPWPSAA